MSSDAAIAVAGLGKAYEIRSAGEGATTLRDALVDRVRHPIRRRRLETFWALRDVDLRVAPGEVVGVIGGNGAGKSTLLKILCRITEPTAGEAVLRGRVGSLLEVGTGFHPELTGRENIYLNGAILGMKRAEITRRLDDIVEFSGIEQFIETPVKRYSSGMYVRLAFAVAAHLQPEILIVDEVLAVGDAEFQQRCLGKMEEAATQEGRTILFVSHNLAAVESLCTRAVVLRSGRVVFDGDVEGAVSAYMRSGDGTRAETGCVDLSGRLNSLQPSGRPVAIEIETRNRSGATTTTVPLGGDLSVRVRTDGFPLDALVVGLRLRDASNMVMASVSTRMAPLVAAPTAEGGSILVDLHRLLFIPGDYWVDLTLKDGATDRKVDVVEGAIRFTVAPHDLYGSGYQPTSADGRVCVEHEWSVEVTEAGDDQRRGSQNAAQKSCG